MRCPRCRKSVKEMYLHCPFCGQKMPEKRNPKFGRLNLCLLLLAILQTGAVVFLAFGLLSGAFAVHQLEKQNYDRAIRLLERVPFAQSTQKTGDGLQRAAENLLRDSSSGTVSYDTAAQTVSRMIAVSDDSTASELSRILQEIETEKAGSEIVSRIQTLSSNGEYLAAYEQLASAERSSDWQTFSSRTKTALASEKRSLTEKLTAQETKKQHFFSDGDGKGALYYASLCNDWNDGIFPETNRKCLDYLNSINTDTQWRDLLRLCRSSFQELESFYNMPGFSYGDYEAIRQNTINTRTEEQTSHLLDLINRARTANRLGPLRQNFELNTIARSIAGSPIISDDQVESLKLSQSRPVTALDCYTYVLNSDMLADEVFAQISGNALNKQHFKSENETLLNADWIQNVGIHMNISSFGTIYWFIIATGNEPEILG